MTPGIGCGVLTGGRVLAGPFDISYFFVRLSLFIVAVVILFVTIWVLPPPIPVLALVLFIPPGLHGAATDKSAVQKRE